MATRWLPDGYPATLVEMHTVLLRVSESHRVPEVNQLMTGTLHAVCVSMLPACLGYDTTRTYTDDIKQHEHITNADI